MNESSISDDTLVFFGGDVKALGDQGLIGGPVVLFGDPSTADIQGDYFTAKTDYGLDISTKARVVYHHGKAKYGPKKFGVGEMKAEIDRIWVQAQLDLSDPDGQAVFAEVKAGKLGWSSGSVERLVVRGRDMKGVTEIISWPISELTLSPKPVDRRLKAVSLKALMEGFGSHAHEAAIAAIDRLHSGLRDDLRQHMGSDKEKAERYAACKACVSSHAIKSRRVVKAMIDDDLDTDDDSIKSLLESAVAAPSLTERSEALVADAGEILGLYAKALEQREAEGRTLSPAKCAEIKAIFAGFDSLVARLPDPDGERRKRLRMLRVRAALA